MESDVNKYLIRCIIRHINGDLEEFRRLRQKAVQIYEEEQYQKRCVCTIGELTPRRIKRRLYQITRGNRAC